MRRTRLFPTSLAIGLLLVACSNGSTSDSGDSSTGGSSDGGSSGSSNDSGAPNAGTATGGESGTGGSNVGGTAGTGGDSPSVGGESGGGSGGDAGGGSGGEPIGEPDAGEAPPGLPAGYTLQLEESFASAASLDRMVFANPTEWSHAEESGGYLQATGHSYNNPQYYSPHSIGVLKEKTFGSFVLEVELLQTTMTGAHRDFAIFWGMQGPNQYYYAHIGQAHDDAASHNIHIVDNADRTAITDTFTDGFDWGDGVWHRFRVVRDTVSGSMEVYGDDAPDPILTANDTTLGEGYIGFGSFDDNGAVRNVRIWALESGDAAAPFFESAP